MNIRFSSGIGIIHLVMASVVFGDERRPASEGIGVVRFQFVGATKSSGSRNSATPICASVRQVRS